MNQLEFVDTNGKKLVLCKACVTRNANVERLVFVWFTADKCWGCTDNQGSMTPIDQAEGLRKLVKQKKEK